VSVCADGCRIDWHLGIWPVGDGEFFCLFVAGTSRGARRTSTQPMISLGYG
jgi:hypothetical protein